ncbi:MAG: DUF4140 domain-containing protein [Pseudodesulfovibrio sp.]|uniref:Uncharacterized protein n=1 Tax=Pseudodesulfovibrio aespoeensis (strain ATCC 700646 / DSM 10631 / Aspo-2) TaxID=643562 RepID=E6VWV6_PSEA9|nr:MULTISPECIES: DUF4139 domain-containing protein [Pseudodesulfovibrio]MBU4379764.1 DUF4140 domain-containing protein [Pseudomonadota bacterium]ADU63718.1 hypothetical protein Daes_2722 [Pseudodesulfovibrio aespoeensis Aspo-2]MBU4474434.1 DUF4140 domain-containing protein [Pseudomonadota bacterium]MBU4515460.1 DUF4140 domain-containing protein [Pseudomonadota bacterium]MBU4522354.1 DUF4140 domain-containing protein [Pseudomonadota bacterium]
MSKSNTFNFFALVLSLALPLALPAVSHGAGTTGAALAVYNSGRALVEETRSVTLPKGPARVVFKDVPATLEPGSVRASAPGMRVLGLEYASQPITVQSLLDRYVGRELTVILPDPADATARTLRKATLLSNEGAPIFLVGDEVYVGSYEALLLPELPADLTREPTLALLTENENAGKQDVRLTYLMGGLTWRADYTLTVGPSGDSGSLDAWATLENQSGYSHSGAALKLVAGDVRQAPAPRMAKGLMMTRAMNEGMDSAAQPVEESFSEYHVYTVEQPVDLPGSGMVQLSLFSAPNVTLAQELSSRFQSGIGQMSGPVKQAADLTLRLDNIEKNGLGKPMPAGLVRVFMPASDKRLLLAGESQVGHVGRGGEIRLTLGRSFDVAVTRTQTGFARLGKNSVEMTWRIEVQNGKKAPQAISLTDGYPGQWTVTAADQAYTTPDSGSLQFDLTVPPSHDGKPTVVNYTVQVTY